MNPLRSIARRLQRAFDGFVHPPWTPSGHFYSPVPSRADVGRAASYAHHARELPGIDLNEEEQYALARRLATAANRIPANRDSRGRWRYDPVNVMFNIPDAGVLFAMLDEVRPAKIIEVGSGYSSAVMLDWVEQNEASTSVTLIEPYTDRLDRLLRHGDAGRTTILRSPVQEVGHDVFGELGKGDVLFVDSTHVAKAGSDVNFLLFEVVPRLPAGVVIHFHDIFWPFEYPDPWLREGRSWNESYMLRAWLIHNDRVRLKFFPSWLWHTDPDFIAEHFPAARHQHPGSIWLETT